MAMITVAPFTPCILSQSNSWVFRRCTTGPRGLPVKKDRIAVPADTDIFFKSPQVRYRTLLPGDQDFFNPWKTASDEHQNIWLETTLRLKLNTIEGYTTIAPGYGMTDYARLIDSYGLVLTSHHTSGLNTSFSDLGRLLDEGQKHGTTPIPPGKPSGHPGLLPA